jgi:hypothetical protein
MIGWIIIILILTFVGAIILQGYFNLDMDSKGCKRVKTGESPIIWSSIDNYEWRCLAGKK